MVAITIKAFMREVAVIGAGASGLVASRHLLQQGMRPTILEASHRIGGAWCNNSSHGASSGSDNNVGKMWDSLHTNLSKYTCSFSDYPHDPKATKDFLSHQEMQGYLESYASEYVDPSCFRFGCHVTRVQPRSSSSGSISRSDSDSAGGYRVEWTEKDNDNDKQQSASFDAVVVATGFFASPSMSSFIVKNDNKQKEEDLSSFITHSSKYKSPIDFKEYPQVAVCGASFSALEIAADLARSSLRDDRSGSSSSGSSSSKVLHILPYIPYVLPRFLPYNEEGAGGDESDSDEQQRFYMPLDCALYRRSCNGDDNVLPEQTSLDKDECRLRHEALLKLVDRRKQQRAIGLPSEKEQPPFVAISDDYLNLVLGGQIEVVRGQRLVQATLDKVDDKDGGEQDASRLRLELDSGETITTAHHLIDCTGYSNPQLGEFLDESILETLQYDATDSFAPLVLCHDTLHPDLPGLGFVGMYRGPYLGAMELQARLLASLWSGEIELSPQAMERALQESQQIRQPPALSDTERRRPQFPHFDYPGFMDSLASYLDLVPKASTPFGLKKQVVLPAFYQPNLPVAQATLDQYNFMKSPAHQMQILPRVIFNALVGQWLFSRTLTHFKAGTTTIALQQNVSGRVKFTPQTPAPSFESTVLLYREDGVLHLPRGDMEVFREYEYSLAGSRQEQLEIHFVEGGKKAGLFLNLQFIPQSNDSNQVQHRYEASSDHLCIKDLYSGKFQIDMDGVAIRQMTMTYRVQGPNKDYESVTTLQPNFSS